MQGAGDSDSGFMPPGNVVSVPLAQRVELDYWDWTRTEGEEGVRQVVLYEVRGADELVLEVDAPGDGGRRRVRMSLPTACAVAAAVARMLVVAP